MSAAPEHETAPPAAEGTVGLAPLFSISFYDTGPLAGEPAAAERATLSIPAGAQPRPGSRKQYIYDCTYADPPRIPAEGLVVVRRAGREVLRFAHEAKVPVAQQARALGTGASESPGDADARGGTPAGGAAPDAAEAMCPGYAALPDTQWAQLNSTADPVVVQVKLAKLPPSPAHRGPGGAYHVYGVVRFALHLDGPGHLLALPLAFGARLAGQSDREAILAI
jgi:hypothetical protein